VPTGMMLFHPRMAVPSDLPSVVDIVWRAYLPYVDRVGRKPGPMTDDYSALIGSSRVHVIDNDGSVQAILVLIPEDDVMLLDNIAVAPSAQRRGLGRKLIDYAEKIARELGYRSIRLYTNEVMTENIDLYARIGYLETHRGEEAGLKRVHMAKALD
jgi:ribosomal protein S18 acetylase RimI-like enzyme